MIGNKLYTGIVVDEEYIKIAKIKVNGKKASLISLDQVRLVESLKQRTAKIQDTAQGEDVFGGAIDDSIDDDELIFGLDDDDTEDISIDDTADIDDDLDLGDLDDDLDDLDDLDFDNLDDSDDSDEIVDTDMIDETEGASSNELLLYNIFNSISSKRVDLGLSIPAGQTIFQILKDVDFSDTKRKDLQIIVDDRLEALHGVAKAEDYYSYSVRDDGALLLTSIDDEPDLLRLINQTRETYRGKLFINEILPDEIILLGLIRSNYDLDINSITGVIQFGENTSRILFLKGNQLWIVSPTITEGAKSKKFLSTIFSKILFQLDTGEVPNLDRLIICNNSLGETAIEFFEERFQDVDVSEFEFSDDIFDTGDINESSVAAFTTAIGAAWTSAGFKKENFPGISFLPGYVEDRQKIFKLQWHGFLLLFFILLTPIVSNHFYTQYASEIDRLENDINTLDSQIRSLESTVQRYNQISSELQQIQSKLDLLNELNQGTLRWSTNLNLMNRGFDDINSLWLTTMDQGQGNTIEIDGIAIYKNRIPKLADLFEKATLLNVTSEIIREQDVYRYRYLIHDFFEDETIYSVQAGQNVQNIMQD